MYIYKSGKYYLAGTTPPLRCGLTTGACAAIASKAALLSYFMPQVAIAEVSLTSSQGLILTSPIQWVRHYSPTVVAASVIKDGGDDTDATTGCSINSTIELYPLEPSMEPSLNIVIQGGEGVGRISKEGLKCPVGSAAINPSPMSLIKDTLEGVCKEYGFIGSIEVTISVPNGKELALHTMGARLGITGGISILGTTGLVTPQSDTSYMESIELELHTLSQSYTIEARKHLVLSVGSYKEELYKEYPKLKGLPIIQCGNYIGTTIDLACSLKWQAIILVGNIAKLIKLSGGIMNTHSKVADCRRELLCLSCALQGGTNTTLEALLKCTTVNAALKLLGKDAPPVIAYLHERALYYLNLRVARRCTIKLLYYPKPC